MEPSFRTQRRPQIKRWPREEQEQKKMPKCYWNGGRQIIKRLSNKIRKALVSDWAAALDPFEQKLQILSEQIADLTNKSNEEAKNLSPKQPGRHSNATNGDWRPGPIKLEEQSDQEGRRGKSHLIPSRKSGKSIERTKIIYNPAGPDKVESPSKAATLLSRILFSWNMWIFLTYTGLAKAFVSKCHHRNHDIYFKWTTMNCQWSPESECL